MVQCIQYITCFLFVCIVLFLLLSFWCFVHTQTIALTFPCVQHIQFFPETTTWLSQFSREQVWKSSTQQLWISVSAVLYLGDDLCFRSKAEVRPCCQSTLHAFSYSQSILRVQYVPIARACQSWHISLYYSASATFLERISCLLETVKKKKRIRNKLASFPCGRGLISVCQYYIPGYVGEQRQRYYFPHEPTSYPHVSENCYF